MVFFDVILPVLLIAAVGFILGRRLDLDPRPLARVTLYGLSPSLVMWSLSGASLDAAEVLDIALFALLLTGGMTAAALIVARGFGLHGPRRMALLLSSLFMNAGNYGMPVVLFALGPEALQRAVVFVIVQNLLTYTVGIAIAAQGRGAERTDLGRAARAMFGQPAFYAGLAGFGLRAWGDAVPDLLLRPLELLAGAAIPVLLLLLGLQMARVRPQVAVVRDVALASVLRLGLSPLLALVLAGLLQMPDLTARVLILEAAMPSAVVVTLLAVEFDALPEVVSSTTLTTTLASTATVTTLLAFLA
ncbi:MAG TPA: AEC family transporter [Bacillota bacterium]